MSNADDVLRLWNEDRERWRSAVPLGGCARPRDERRVSTDGVRVWQGFSSNNSGDCLLVGKFEDAGAAAKIVEDLREGYEPGEPFGEPWTRLLHEAGIEVQGGEYMPDTFVAIGRTVLAHTGMAVEDDFPSLRALVWKKRGTVVSTLVHSHDPLALVLGLGFDDVTNLEAAEVALGVDDIGSFHRRGRSLLGVSEVRGMGTATEQLERVRAITAEHHGVVAAEAVEHPQEGRAKLASVLAAPRASEEVQHLFVRFRDEYSSEAKRFASEARGAVGIAGGCVVVTAPSVPPHLAARAHARGGTAWLVGGRKVTIEATFYLRGGPIDAEPVAAELRTRLGSTVAFDVTCTSYAATATFTTENPAYLLPSLDEFAKGRRVDLHLSASSPRALVDAVNRVDVDLAHLLRQRR